MVVVSLRRAVPGDAQTLRAVARAAYARYVPRVGREPAPMTADYRSLAVEAEVWLAEHEGRVVGLLVLRPGRDHLDLENVAVHPDMQGRGVGGQLLRYAEQRAGELGLAAIHLYTHETMTENLAMYGRHGYVQTRRAEQDGYARVFCTKRLDR